MKKNQSRKEYILVERERIREKRHKDNNQQISAKVVPWSERKHYLYNSTYNRKVVGGNVLSIIISIIEIIKCVLTIPHQK